jgi:phytoene dehydrogenase-like protein
MRSDADVIVIGSGHNALISAAYLALGGQTVLVLEAQELHGGNTMTEELTLPGFRHDSCSTAHTLIQGNPLMSRNELRLDRYGLKYLLPDPVYVVPFADGESLTMWLDVDRTVAEIERFSVDDARAYRQLLADWELLRPLQAAERNAPPKPPEESQKTWREGSLGDAGLRIRLAAGLDLIQERFENPRVQAFFAWVSMMTLEPIDHPNTGMLPFSLISGRQQHGWAVPEGGSGALPDALIRVIEECGGWVVCSARVESILTEAGEAVGVKTSDGRNYYAGRAVLSSAHATQLPAALSGLVDKETEVSLARWSPGLSMFVAHFALARTPRYRTWNGETESLAAGAIESIDNLRAQLADFRRGRLHLDSPFLLCLNPSLIDASRAPVGKHTLKIVGIQPYALAECAEQWDEVKQRVGERMFEVYLRYTTNLTTDDVLASLFESPLDLERRNPNNFRGSCHGGSSAPWQTGWYRPAPKWNCYRTPVPRLYLTGSTTHPGGSVSGYPGRNAARTMFEDLGLSWDAALARAEAISNPTGPSAASRA